MNDPEITCNACDGSGQRPLSAHKGLHRTYLLLKKKGPCPVDSLLENGITGTAINARLNDLEEAGLAERSSKQGRKDIWRAKR